MKLRQAKALILSLILALALGAGCAMERNVDNMDKSTASMAAELKSYEEYVKALTKSMQIMTEQISLLTKSVVELQQMSKDAFNLFMQRMQSQPPALVPPMDEVEDGLPLPQKD